jgi:tripartite-type tricarboxylate transporter receptor subunit TctC
MLPPASQIAQTSLAWAQTYPTRPITMIVPVAAGGMVDTVGRLMAEGMRSSLRQPIIIENVTGADGSIGTGRAARARPDGYTIDLGFLGTHVLNAGLYSLSYDPVIAFAPISLLTKSPLGLFASKMVPAKDLNELIAWLKLHPNKASMGVTAAGPRLVATLFQRETQTHFSLVPYRGTAQSIQDLVAGQIDLYLDVPAPALPHMRAGSIRALAVTGDSRFAAAADIPTFAEMGLPTLYWSAWQGLFAPSGTPTEVIGKLNSAAVQVLADPAVQSRFVDLGVESFPREKQTPEALAAMRKADTEKWLPLIKEFGIKAE